MINKGKLYLCKDGVYRPEILMSETDKRKHNIFSDEVIDFYVRSNLDCFTGKLMKELFLKNVGL